MAGYAKYAFDVQKGMHDGVRGVLFDTAEGLFGFDSDPLGTSYSMLNSLVHPIDTYNIVNDVIYTSYERDVINGDAESRAQWFSYTGGTIITSDAGTKGAGIVSKAGIKIELHLIQREPGSMVELPSSMHKEYDDNFAWFSGEWRQL